MKEALSYRTWSLFASSGDILSIIRENERIESRWLMSSSVQAVAISIPNATVVSVIS